MSLFSLSAPIQTARSAPSLHRRFLIAAGFGGALVLLLLAAGANVLLDRNISRQGDERLTQAASRALLVVSGALEDRVREAKLLAMSPEIIAAAKEGGARAQAAKVFGLWVCFHEIRRWVERS